MKNFFAKLGLLFLSTLLTLGFLEVAVRTLFPDTDVLGSRDPIIGKIHRPNLDLTLHGDGWTSHVITNKEGWMGKDFSIEKPAGIRRFIHLGDSVIEAQQVDTDKTFVSQLETLLPHTEQLNLAVGGQGTLPELLTYEHYGKTYHPDTVVLWFFSGNDWRDNLLSGSVVPQTLSGDSARPVGVVGWTKYVLLQYFRLPRFVYERESRSPAVTQLLLKTGLLSMQPEQQKEAEIPLQYRASVLETPERAQALEATKTLLARFAKEASGSLVLALMPSVLETKPGAIEELQAQYPALKGKTLDLEYSSRTLKTLAAQLHIRFFDLTPTLRDAYARGISPHLLSDGHLSQEGHDIVAKEVAAYFLK